MLPKANLNLILKIVTIITATLAIFHQDLTIILNDALISESMSYILVIPPLFIYLLYRKRKMLTAIIPIENQDHSSQLRLLPTIAGIILSIAGIFLYWHGSYTFTPLQYHLFALPIFVSGLILILFNLKTFTQLIFPLVFLFFLTPPPSEILYGLGSTLSVISSEVSYSLISVLNVPSTLTYMYANPVIQIVKPNGTIISFAVDIACSGIYSLIGFVVFAVFITFIIRDKPWKKFALFLTGLSLIYLLNITRITTILLIGYYSSEETALQLFHILGGWFLILIGTFLLLLFAEKIFHIRIFAKPTQKCVDCNPKPKTNNNFCFTCGRITNSVTNRIQKTDIIKLATIIISVVLLLSIQTPVFALTEGPAEIIVQTPSGEQGNTQLLPQIEGYTLEFLYRDRDFEELARQDASLLYVYKPLYTTKETISVTVEIGTTISKLHNWEVCLISYPIAHGQSASVTRLALKDIQIQENPPIMARYFAFQWVETKQTEVVLYWFETANFMANGTAQKKQLKMSLITYPETAQNLTEAEDLIPFAAAIAEHWEPIKTWTKASVLLSQNSGTLTILTTMLLVPTTSLYLLEKRKQKKANAFAYQKLSKTNKQIIDAIVETEKNAPPTLNTIADTHKNRTGEHIEKEKLLYRLIELEETDIIKRDIVNIKDKPIMIWKTQINTKRHQDAEKQ